MKWRHEDAAFQSCRKRHDVALHYSVPAMARGNQPNNKRESSLRDH
jgi:hypothetical protein